MSALRTARSLIPKLSKTNISAGPAGTRYKSVIPRVSTISRKKSISARRIAKSFIPKLSGTNREKPISARLTATSAIPKLF